jgi:hypothetical protein
MVHRCNADEAPGGEVSDNSSLRMVEDAECIFRVNVAFDFNFIYCGVDKIGLD